MAGTLIRPCLASVALVCAFAPPPAIGAGAGDPFNPPPGLRTTPGTAAAGVTDAETTSIGNQTALVLGLGGLRVGARPAAYIDGEWVGLGAHVRGAKLIAVHLQEAHLRHPDGRVERLSLAPDVQRKPNTQGKRAPINIQGRP